ncbi:MULTISPECIES: hypothetical protein [Caproicibacterium]|jgi:UDP-N-acetylmuramyl tripeptide synthase|uniref:Uncharacterized protein n=1 Tax=Caproicibacterium lactatifermentans TaxID=2666138 RepID=A0A859DS08_9FIRM|nr:hypothetical protein [Caproicibacterium lactatifermentans]MDD4807453.1 hypothetical protein [Oscillospiraceae bacterium]QKN23572.1 hypothetical protein GJQ69_03160 [Caproicibacterium lactatifermentans]QKO29752.1 hypothetical protein GKP14_01205 [Caproicibacterium lactatifermentans]
MESRSIVVSGEPMVSLLNRLLQSCGLTDLQAVLPGKEKKKVLLVADREPMLRYVSGFQRCLASYPLREDPRLHSVQLFTYSLESDSADYNARGLHVTPQGYTAFEIVGVGCIGRVRLKSLAEGEEERILAAVAAAVVCGAPLAKVLSCLQA